MGTLGTCHPAQARPFLLRRRYYGNQGLHRWVLVAHADCSFLFSLAPSPGSPGCRAVLPVEKPMEVLAHDFEVVADLGTHRQTWGPLLLISKPSMLWHKHFPFSIFHFPSTTQTYWNSIYHQSTLFVLRHLSPIHFETQNGVLGISETFPRPRLQCLQPRHRERSKSRKGA